jgi:hypothetical protein
VILLFSAGTEWKRAVLLTFQKPEDFSPNDEGSAVCSSETPATPSTSVPAPKTGSTLLKFSFLQSKHGGRANLFGGSNTSGM